MRRCSPPLLTVQRDNGGEKAHRLGRPARAWCLGRRRTASVGCRCSPCANIPSVCCKVCCKVPSICQPSLASSFHAASCRAKCLLSRCSPNFRRWLPSTSQAGRRCSLRNGIALSPSAASRKRPGRQVLSRLRQEPSKARPGLLGHHSREAAGSRPASSCPGCRKPEFADPPRKLLGCCIRVRERPNDMMFPRKRRGQDLPDPMRASDSETR